MPERRGLRLLMTADTLGGVWDYALELVRHLAANGTETILATMGRAPTAAQQRAAAAIAGLTLETSEFKLEWMPDAGDDPRRAGEWLLELEQRHAPDLIHCNGYLHGALPWRVPVLLVAHSCVLSWWQAVKGEAAPAAWQRYAEGVRNGLRHAVKVIAPTATMLASLRQLYGPLPGAAVVWNGRSPLDYLPGRKEDFIFTAGRFWDEGKNIAALCDVAADLDWPVCAAGEWRRPEGGGGEPSGIRCLGTLTPQEMRAWLGRAAIYVLPARYEPFGLSILEAALCRCALVLGDIPSLRELWDGAALFVPPDDHDRLQAALRTLCAHPQWRRTLGQAARERALLYSSDRMANAYLRVYRELLQARPATAVAARGFRAAAQPMKI